MKKTNIPFNKPPLSISEQIIRLQSRGLLINDHPRCYRALTNIGYYRLSGYMIPFYENPRQNHIFKSDVTFERIIDDYEFDRQLRSICLRAIEEIEVAFRVAVSDYMSLVENNSHWYENKKYFKDQQYHLELMRKMKSTVGRHPHNQIPKSREKFIDHYNSKYTHPELPPCWMVFETFSFGDISFLFKNLHDRYRKKIAKSFGQDDKILSSWIHSLCYLRNLCAHHARVWNREMSISPKLAKLHQSIQLSGKSNLLYGLLVIIKIIFDKINPANTWMSSLVDLFIKYPHVNIERMGFRAGWEGAFDGFAKI